MIAAVPIERTQHDSMTIFFVGSQKFLTQSEAITAAAILSISKNRDISIEYVEVPIPAGRRILSTVAPE